MMIVRARIPLGSAPPPSHGPVAVEKCIDEQDRTGIGFSGPPSDQLVPINMQLDLAAVCMKSNTRF